MAFDANDLSPHEHFVVERTIAGETADFTPMAGPGGVKPIIRAGFLRKLMLGVDPTWTIRTPGVRLKGARVEGVLDLTDCSGVGAVGLPALALVECEIPEIIDLSHSRLARFSLNASRLSRLIAVETEIDRHYAEQLEELGDSDPELSAMVLDFQADELEHKATALAQGAERAPAYPVMSAIIRLGCRTAIAVSKRL